MISNLSNEKISQTEDIGRAAKRPSLRQRSGNFICDILRAMPSINSKSDWAESPKQPEQQRSLLRKRQQPLAVYDLSKKTKGQFFFILGKVTFLCLIGVIVSTAVVWAVHRFRPGATASPAIDHSAESSYAPAYIPIGAQPPQLGYVVTWGVSSTSASVTWSTNNPSTTSLAYGVNRDLDQLSPVQTALSNTHGVTLDGLNPGTTYYYAAQSTGENEATGRSSIYSFTTKPADGSPAISKVTVIPGKNNKLEISWTTSVPTYSYVQFGPTSTYNRWSARTDLTTNPKPAVAWVPSGIMHYQLVSTDTTGHQTVSPDQTFTEP